MKPCQCLTASGLQPSQLGNALTSYGSKVNPKPQNRKTASNAQLLLTHNYAMKIPKLPAGEIARRAVQAKESIEVSTKARAAAIASEKALHDAFGIRKKTTPRPEHGQQIFVFNHLQRNHVVYSLTRAMKVFPPILCHPIPVILQSTYASSPTY